MSRTNDGRSLLSRAKAAGGELHEALAYIVMAYIVMAYIVMAYVVMAYYLWPT